MKECTLHRDAVVRFGPHHAQCPLCYLMCKTRELWKQAEESGKAAWRAGSYESCEVMDIDHVLDAIR